jgi:hypothetical protein
MNLTLPLALSYPVTFIPKGCRKPTTEYFLADEAAQLQTVNAVDADIAFRVHMSGAEGAFEILSWNDKLWWPLRLFSREEGAFTLATSETLLSEIKTGRENFLLLRPMWLAARKIETAEIRTIMSNGHQAALATAQRKISDYLMLCGGMPYVAHGEAVYVDSGIAGIGADRTARVQRDWTNYQARSSSLTLRSFCRGDFYHAAEFGSAAKRPYIEIVRPDLVRAPRAELQLDAFFRCALEWLEMKDKFPPAEEVRRGLEIFSHVADQNLTSASISRDRLVALNYFMEFIEKFHRQRFSSNPFADFDSFARTQELVSDPCKVTLTKQEEDALDDLGL